MSKSLGNVIEPFQVVDLYGADALRFYCSARCSFGAGRRGLARGLRDPLHDRARQRVRQPGQPHAGDDRALPRRRGARRRARRRRWPRSSTGSRSAVAARSTQVELTPRARRDLAARQAAEPVRAGRGALEARQGRGARPTGSTRCSTRSPRASGSCPCCCHPFMPGSAGAAAGRRSGARTSRSTARALGAAGGGARIGELGQLFPRVEAEAPAA